MSEPFQQTITELSAWLGSDLGRDRSWVVTFTPEDLAEIDHALRGVKARGLSYQQVGAEDFPLPTLQSKLTRELEKIRTGRGFSVLRGLPVDKYSDEESLIAYWGIGRHLGDPVKQNIAGDLIGQIRDFGKKWGELSVRGYQTNGQLIFHTDYSDVVGLLCLRQPKSGGLSRIASSVTVHNEIIRHHPEYLPILYRGYRYIKREAVDSAQPVTENLPVYGYRDGYLSCRVIRERIDSAYRKLGTPLTGRELDALDYIAAVANSERVRLDMDLLPGDMQFLNNYTVMHSRTAFEDGEKPEERRHLLRLWLSFHDHHRPLPEDFPPANGYATPGQPPPPGAVALGLAL
ncbi:MAG: TauD/TfdA family dioxygenase [Acetobacteraceae bacterium]